jgi:RimJ/RimL family protein N-acetyltransferase
VIRIEPLTAEHFAIVARWLSNPRINEWLTSEWRDREVDPMLVGVAMRNRRNRWFLVRCEVEPCGLVALADWDPVDRIAMVWYVLGEQSIGGRGVISEALAQLVRLSFSEFEIEALHAWIMEDNERSRRVLEKTGFQEVGRLRRATRHGERQLARVYFDLTREDHDAGRARTEGPVKTSPRPAAGG